ncbi:MAG: M15 family metallopeptidase [Oscillospiraceae bacterium]|nr:M15 family metallopeptidase [Oscillospiraceae bacterium]
MNRRVSFTGFLAVAALALCLAVPVSADYADLTNQHWAYSSMDSARALGIINGVGGNRMAPQGELTWAQFLAMLSRAFAPEQYRAASATLPWDRAGFQAAQDAGLLQREDAPMRAEEALGEAITRQDTALLLSRALPEYAREIALGVYHGASYDKPVEEALSDFNDMDAAHQQAVSLLYDISIIHGKDDGSFGAADTLKRADGSVLLMRTLNVVDRARYGETVRVTLRFIDSKGQEIAAVPGVECEICDRISFFIDAYLPKNYAIVDYNGARYISSACSEYTVIVRPMTQLEIEEKTASDRYYSGEITLDEYTMQDFWLRVQGENYRKHVLLFGDRNKRRFDSRAEAEQSMTSVTVPVWNLRRDKKVASTATLTVHAALAEDVTAIFTEIFNDPEQFPIQNLGGYAWRGDSATGEHNCGTAIDINADQNYQVRDGQALAGSLWSPGTNPYSIPEDGSVVRIFAAHGWSWGGDAWSGDTDPTSGYHDYMHFSYMGG